MRLSQIGPSSVRRLWIGSARCAFRFISRLVPKRTAIVMRAFPDFDDQSRAISMAAVRCGLVCTLLVDEASHIPGWAEDRRLCVKRVRSLSGFVTYLRASHVFFTHGLYLSPKPVRGQTIVNVWHGMPIKKICAQLGEAFVPEFSYTLASHRYFVQPIEEAFRVPASKVLLMDLPRNDIFSAVAPKSLSAESDYIVMLPTYRARNIKGVSIDGDDRGDIPTEDEIQRLDRTLRDLGLSAFVKQHPMATPWSPGDWDSGAIKILKDDDLQDKNISLYELLAGASALVTDYSSVAVDFSQAGGVVFLVNPDLAQYAGTRGLNLSSAQLAEFGSIVGSYNALSDALRSFFEGARESAFTRSSPKTEGQATDMLFRFVGLIPEQEAAR